MDDTCIQCKGRGRIYGVVAILFFGAIRALPRFRKCPNCNGFGHIDNVAPEGYVNDMETGRLRKL